MGTIFTNNAYLMQPPVYVYKYFIVRGLEFTCYMIVAYIYIYIELYFVHDNFYGTAMCMNWT